MAKGLRNRWRRSCRAAKRIRYKVKEVARLKKVLGIADDSGNVNMQDLSEVATVVDAKTIQEQQASTSNGIVDDDDRKKLKLKDKHGNYPVWMHSRKVQKMERENVAKKRKLKAKKRKIERCNRRVKKQI